MKRVEIERAAIVKAIDESPNKNITLAARTLGSSRRTLQSRMRDYGMEPGKSGRPRELLPYSGDSGFSLSTVLVVGVAFGIGYWLWKRDSEQIAGSSSAELVGLDVICGR